MDAEMKNNINRIYAIVCLITGGAEVLVNVLLLLASIASTGFLTYCLVEICTGGSPKGIDGGATILAFIFSVMFFCAFLVFTLITLGWLVYSVIVFIWTLLYFINKNQKFKQINITFLAGAKALVEVLFLVSGVFYALAFATTKPAIWITAVEVLLLLICCALIVFSVFVLVINIRNNDKSDDMKNVTIAEDCK